MEMIKEMAKPSAWDTPSDGVALGPVAVVTDPQLQVQLQAQLMWTDEQGNVLCLSVPEDAVTVAAARKFAQALLMLCSVSEPAGDTARASV